MKVTYSYILGLSVQSLKIFRVVVRVVSKMSVHITGAVLASLLYENTNQRGDTVN